MEHHSNIVPWQMLRDATGIELRVAPITDAGELDMPAFEALLQDGRVGLVAITHMSNVLGTYTPAERIAALAHAYGAKVMFDGSQAVVHRRVDVQALDADFYVFTGHKLYGPTGIGVLWGRRELLDQMPPFLGGGDMISSVSYARSTWAEAPHKFEAGTPPILEGIGLGAAIEFVNGIGFEAISAHEAVLTEHAIARMSAIPGLTIVGRAQDRGGVISFTLDGAHAHDVADPARPPGHRGPRRPPLRRAADAAPRPGQHRARQLRRLHHAGRDRRLRRHAGPGAELLRVMFDEVRDLYQETILDRGRHPRHATRLAAYDAAASGDNPMCGDRCRVFIRRDPAGTVDEIGYEARGCAISIASADLMAEIAPGRGRDALHALAASFDALARTGDSADPATEPLRPLSGVHEYPSRVKCATLPWRALLAALDGATEATSE